MHVNRRNENWIVSVDQNALRASSGLIDRQDALLFAVRDLIEEGYSETAAYAKTYNHAAFYD